MTASFSSRLIAWQRRHGRSTLPWQNTRDPYRVWLSEVMLQQTQVSTVLGYYERFLARCPDVAALAAAPIDDVLALWSGLGYYSRARNLHACAIAVVRDHGGAFPRSSAALATLPGIGRSTAAAIAAFCFGERVAILDGNVKRVLSRWLAFEADLAAAKNERVLWDQASALLPERGVETYTQALMDLGATLCTARAPRCGDCPVRTDCRALQQGRPERYPVKTRTLRRGMREHVWLWLAHGDRLLLVPRPARGIWAGLWSLPEFDSPAAFDAACAAWPGEPEPLPSFVHTLTHLDWTLHPVRWTLPGGTPTETLTAAWPGSRWFDRREALTMGLPAPLRRLIEAY